MGYTPYDFPHTHLQIPCLKRNSASVQIRMLASSPVVLGKGSQPVGGRGFPWLFPVPSHNNAYSRPISDIFFSRAYNTNQINDIKWVHVA